MTRDQIESELSQIQSRRKEIEVSLEQAEQQENDEKAEEITKELEKLAARVKHLLFKLGKYRYPDDETIEINGQVMPANVYHWLKE